MMKYNKGEWSELYAFLKILAQRNIPIADKYLTASPTKTLSFHKVIRGTGDHVRTYDLTVDHGSVFIADASNKLIKTYGIARIQQGVLAILDAILHAKQGKGSFVISTAESLMRDLLCDDLKASGGSKEDIDAIVEDRFSEREIRLGFSIKSMLGAPSTLLNASGSTRFVYEVLGFDGSIERVNAIDSKGKVQDRVRAINNAGGTLSFLEVANTTFQRNLRMVDSNLDDYLAQMLLVRYMNSDLSSLSEVTERLSTLHAPSLPLDIEFYKHKIVNFLGSVALGLTPNTPWSGKMDANGGYIVVKSNGDVVCYHIYDRDDFHEYLYENTKFETPSTSRHKFGLLYKKDDRLFFDLVLQIRFVD